MESSASAGSVTCAVLDPRRWWALALLCSAFFMPLLAGAITIAALPSIGAGLRFSEHGLRWVLSAYASTFGGLCISLRMAARSVRRLYDRGLSHVGLRVTGYSILSRLAAAGPMPVETWPGSWRWSGRPALARWLPSFAWTTSAARSLRKGARP